MDQETDTLIVGAGMAGLSAAAKLTEAGHRVLVVDKGRGVGGRLSSRRLGPAVFDHGAQFMTARDPRLLSLIEVWRGQGVVEEWYRSFGDEPDGHPRYRGAPTMSALAKHLARVSNVLLQQRITALRLAGSGWLAEIDGGATISARAAILTPPVPQTLALLDAGGVRLAPSDRARLEAVGYERCLAVLAVLDGPSRIPPPGALLPKEGPIAWIADNQQKGVSPVPAVTLHATAAFSLEHWDRDRDETAAALLRAAEVWLGSAVIDSQIHGWRYSKPLRVEESPCSLVSESPPLVIAGDAFGGPRVEGAALSGWAAAEVLEPMLG